MRFKVVPVSKQYILNLRSAGRDEFGHQIIEQVAGGYGPCRVSLRPFKPGVDRRMLLSHSPFKIANAFNQPGPVFVNSADVEEYSDVHRFPPEIKADKQNFPLSLIGYNHKQEMVFSELVGDQDVEVMIERVFADEPTVEYLHARNAKAGCFICKIERVDGQELEISKMPGDFPVKKNVLCAGTGADVVDKKETIVSSVSDI